MEPWLKAKTAGLPRWAWLALLGGGLALGLYLRSQDTGEEEEEPVEEPSEDELEYYDGTEQAGGLAAAGLVGPAQGQVVPVEAPYIPEGFVDIFGEQSQTTQALIAALAEREPGERVEVIREQEPGFPAESSAGLTGGGAPRRKPNNKAPKKPKQKKPRKKQPKQKGRRPGHKAPHKPKRQRRPRARVHNRQRAR